MIMIHLSGIFRTRPFYQSDVAGLISTLQVPAALGTHSFCTQMSMQLSNQEQIAAPGAVSIVASFSLFLLLRWGIQGVCGVHQPRPTRYVSLHERTSHMVRFVKKVRIRYKDFSGRLSDGNGRLVIIGSMEACSVTFLWL